MPSLVQKFEAKTDWSSILDDEKIKCKRTVTKDPTGKEKVWGSQEGTVNIYTDEELALLCDAGLTDEHAVLLNQIVVIRAQDTLRRTMRGQSVEDPQIAELKALGLKGALKDPSKLAAIKALLAGK